jgi:exopolyphosphatase/guanosine-5'-triphosphate,3'-diphosphate pyrophosphatase
MALTDYPLPIIHHYEMDLARIGRLQTWLTRMDKAQLKAMNISNSRIPTLPDAVELLSLVTGRLGSSRLIVSAFGLREGLLYEALPDDVAAEDPLLAAARMEGDAQGRFAGHGDQIARWISPLFQDDEPRWARIRLAACLLADVGWRANPEFRAERGMEVALHGNWVGLTAEERAVLAQALHANFGGSLTVVPALEKLARPDNLLRAMQWGLAIRLCQRLSGGAAGPLAGSSLSLQGDHILLYLDELYSDLAGEIVERRLKQIGQTMNRPVHLQIGPAQ